MRNFLIVAVLFDQMVHSRFHSLHEDFYQTFTVPKLLAHGGCGCAKPDWLLNHQHGFDKNVDWLQIKELATGASLEIFQWIEAHHSITREAFESMLEAEIIETFDAEHCDKLLSAFQLNNEA